MTAAEWASTSSLRDRLGCGLGLSATLPGGASVRISASVVMRGGRGVRRAEAAIFAPCADPYGAIRRTLMDYAPLSPWAAL